MILWHICDKKYFAAFQGEHLKGSYCRSKLASAMLYMWLFVTSLRCSRFIPVSASDVQTSECPSVVYLKVGKMGQIPCMCGEFTIISWYLKAEYDERGSPIVNFNKVRKGGYGYYAGEYDIGQNGSLILNNVTRDHEGFFVVTVADDIQRREETITIQVVVVVVPVPSHPVVNGKVNQQHVYMDVSRNGTLQCSMHGVYPNISLTWTSQSDKIIFEHGSVSKTPSQGDVFDVSITSRYHVSDLTIKRLTVYCRVPDADGIAVMFPETTTVDLLLLPVYPVVNGHLNQAHVYIDANRVGMLTCLKESVNGGTRLEWEIADPALRGKVTLENNSLTSNNGDGTVNINETVHYIVHYSVDRIMLKCALVEKGSSRSSIETKVDLLFENVYPVVNGHVNQKHIYLDVERKGHLTCVKENVDYGTTLVWELVDPSMQNKISFQSSAVISSNNDGTRNINQTFVYEVHDHSLERLTIECKIVEPDTDEHLPTTKVDLLFENVYPVVNGLVNQKHVYLDVERKGHLTCVKENVGGGSRLFWALDPAIRGKVTFHSTSGMSINDDDTVNINQTFDYTVHDNSLERVTVECKLLEPDSSEHPYTTTVDLLFPSDPVISGCYHQLHNCILEVERQGELTCTVKNSQYPVYLEWTTWDGDVDYFEFGNATVEHRNNTNLYDVSITTQYTLLDESVTFVMVQCNAYRFESDPVFSMMYASLNVQSGGEYGDKYGTVISYDHMSVTVISSMVLLMLFTIFLMVSILLLFSIVSNKKMQIMNGELEKLNLELHKLYQELRCGLNGKDLTILEDKHKDESAIPDSGNSGSNSRDRSESEFSSEELSLMPGSSTYYKQQVSLEDKGHSEETPMVLLKTFEKC